MDRAEYITCIKQTYETRLSWCGRNICMEFAFENLGHAQEAVAKGSRLTICPECWTTIQDALQIRLERKAKTLPRAAFKSPG